MTTEKLNSFLVVLILIVFGFSIFVGGLLIVNRRKGRLSKEEKTPVRAESEVVVSSQIPDYHPELTDASKLIKHLDRIHFWDKGVVYGKSQIEGQAMIKKMEIIFTSTEQPNSKVLTKDGQVIISSSFQVQDNKGVLLVYIKDKNDKMEKGPYILTQLFKTSAWPRAQWGFSSEQYEQERTNFINSYFQDGQPFFKS